MILKEKIRQVEAYWKKDYRYYSKFLSFKKNINLEGLHLDFGCGLGFFPYMLAKRYPNLIVEGIDINKEEVKFAKLKNSLPNLRFRTSRKISRKYSSISSFFVLHEFGGDIKKMLRKFYSHLLPGGKILIYDFIKASKSDFKSFYDRNPDSSKRSFEEEYEELNKWDLNKFLSFFKDAGFKTLFLKKSEKFWMGYVGEKV